MFCFVRLLRTVYKYTVDGQLDPISVLSALLSKRPYLQLTRLLLARSLQSPTDADLVHDVIRNNYQNEHGWSLIHFAAYEKNYNLMRACIENGSTQAPGLGSITTDNNGNTALHIAIQVAQKTNFTQRSCGDDSWRTADKDDQREYLKIVELILSSSADSNEYEQQKADKQPGKSISSNGTLRENGYNDDRKSNQPTGQQMSRTNRELNKQQSTEGVEQASRSSGVPVSPAEASGELMGPLSSGSRSPGSRPSGTRSPGNQPPFDDHAELQSSLVNKQNYFGKTSLHYACLLKPDRFSIRLITILLKSKANADIADFRNCTPLFYLLAEHQTEHRSRNESARRCSRTCPLRSPFIDLLTDDSLIGYKCDRLNLDELDYGVATLKQLCRQAIQQQSPALQRLQSAQYKALPDSLRSYLSRKVLPVPM